MAESERAITYRGVVRNEQCDYMGHMNVMWYVGKFDEASWQLFASMGLNRSRMQKENRGVVGLEQHIEYKRELRAGDVVSVRSAVVEVKDKVIRLRHEMTNDETGEVAAIMQLVCVYFDMEFRKSMPLPQDIRERATRMIVATAEPK
jgi:acyl-CoA thioester hydrolase